MRKLRPTGVEPVTYGSEDHCSIQLSYGRDIINIRVPWRLTNGGAKKTWLLAGVGMVQ